MTQQLTKVPTLKTGNDGAVAAQLQSLFDDAQNGMRRVVALGMFCYHIKAQLKQGQFQPWLAANCEKISYRSLAAYMQLTKGVLEACGVKTIEGFHKKCSTLHFSHGGELLLLPEAKLPEEAKPLREKICSLIDGKSQRALFLEFKQVDEEDGDGLKKKRGRLKGQGGASKEQRLAAAEREEQERITALKLDSSDFAKWCDDNGDDKGVGKFRASKEWNRLKQAVNALAAYMNRADERASEKGGAQ